MKVNQSGSIDSMLLSQVSTSIITLTRRILCSENIVDPKSFMLHITSGSNDPIDYNIRSDTERTRKMAENLGVVAAVLYQVPNQPLDMTEIEGVQEKFSIRYELAYTL